MKNCWLLTNYCRLFQTGKCNKKTDRLWTYPIFLFSGKLHFVFDFDIAFFDIFQSLFEEPFSNGL
jgi:hypothetical protein